MFLLWADRQIKNYVPLNFDSWGIKKNLKFAKYSLHFEEVGYFPGYT
jgi:hypothetical protein